MLQIIVSRGWTSENNIGQNDSYYLYISKWYRLISSDNLWSSGKSGVIDFGSDGEIRGNGVDNRGGVQFPFYFFLSE